MTEELVEGRLIEYDPGSDILVTLHMYTPRQGC